MPTYTIPNLTNVSGLEDIVIAGSQQIPFLGPGILILVFFIISVSGYWASDRKTGRGNFPMWAAIAGLITTTGGFILFLYSGIINLETIIISMLITILACTWFLLSTREGF